MNTKIIVFGLLLGLSTMAQAAFPEGQWKIDVYSDKVGTADASDMFCIKSNGTWYLVAPSLSGSGAWSGFWVMKGNDIRFHGNGFDSQQQVVWSDSGEVSRVNSKLMTGYWQSWANGTVGNWWIAKFSFMSANCGTPQN